MSVVVVAACAGFCSCFGGLTGAALAKLLSPDTTREKRKGSRSLNKPTRRHLDAESTDSDDVQTQNEPPNADWEGLSMAEARQQADSDQQRSTARTPSEVLALLQKGSSRFWMGAATRPNKSVFERRALSPKQLPCVAVLSCSDSPVPVEIVFDMGLGDVFVVRNAGNCVDTSTMASLLYAIHHLHVKALIVMGHEGCGAIKAARQPAEAFSSEPKAVQTLLSTLKGSLDDSRLQAITDSRARDREAVVTNVRQQLAILSRDEGIMEKIQKKDLVVVGAFYELCSGVVDFFFQLTEPIKAKDEELLMQRTASRGVKSYLSSGSSRSTDSPTFMQRMVQKKSDSFAKTSFLELSPKLF
eukprot:TRINITY_DN22162_c0_g1_i2.p1 TRINITY_DN22162_c0_g1~~TRINITY_DN22162_c0_g1_i2.p1  ORF type:complete len:357 (-),score=64.81 TRINITY_DN22162_c0_g1_i2:111-1181(-)